MTEDGAHVTEASSLVAEASNDVTSVAVYVTEARFFVTSVDLHVSEARFFVTSDSAHVTEARLHLTSIERDVTAVSPIPVAELQAPQPVGVVGIEPGGAGGAGRSTRVSL